MERKDMFKLNQKNIKNVANKKVNESRHKKLLNNLLDIRSQGDNATFYHLSKINQDLTKLIKAKEVKTVFENAEFAVEFTSNFTDEMITKLENVKTYEEFEQWCTFSGYKPSAKIEKDLKRSFQKNFETVLEKIIDKHRNFLKDWKFNINKIHEIYTETGVWPLFLGTFFIKFSRDESYFYAPAILKAVNLSIKNGKVVLSSRDSSVVTNEKLFYSLSQNLGSQMPYLDESENRSLMEATDSLKQVLADRLIDGTISNKDLLASFKEMTREDIANYTSMTLSPGIVLSVCHPSGTKLREAVQNLIINDKIDKLIKADDLFNYDADTTKNLIESSKLIRVTQSDLTQEKAIIGALSTSCVIVGPPGTGKSQTIANILINILEEGKKALFISQKKVAIDVVLKRMQKYSDLVFQFNETNKANKYERGYFYKPLTSFYQQILDINPEQEIPQNNEKFLNSIEYEYYDAKNALSAVLSQDLDAYFNLKRKGDILQKKEQIKKFFELFHFFDTKNDFYKFYNLLDLNKKEAAQKMNAVLKESLIFTKYDKVFDEKYKRAKEVKDYWMANLKEFDINDLIRIAYMMKLNTFSEFDRIEKEYQKFIDNKNKSNVTPEQLENMYARVTLKARKNLENYRSLGEDNEIKLKNFLGKITRGITPPHLITTEYKDLLKHIYNVFVGTPEILSNFVDFENDHYDYVIFDESSQIFIEKALPYIALSDKVIVAGDDQQMQPSNWFNRRDDSEDDYTTDEITSLLDWALHNNLPKFFLEMNYRSNASELILFSSKEFYNSKLKGIDKYNTKTLNSFEVINVKGKWKDNKNIEEAQEVVKLAEKYINDYESMIILAFNRKQQDCIREIIALTSPKLYSLLEEKIILRNLENIQGDEADIVIASIGYTKDTTLSSTYIGTKGGRNALNVAITRAKDKMVVVKSLKADELLIDNSSSLNLLTFKKWLEFLDLSAEEQKSYTTIDRDVIKDHVSYFEQDVIQWLKTLVFNQPVKIKKNYRIGSYTIDIAILDQDSKFLVGISLDDTSEKTSMNEMLEIRLKNDFIQSKEYPIYRISNFRFREEKNTIYKYLNMIINR
ncbi:ATP-binding protein [Mycoplasmopsis pullorum]|nr:ATP-binding protein [Mycoplasmopsis pullorum]TNK92323.1 ATP-binding protein [Mycoplasmopsis pullorum]